MQIEVVNPTTAKTIMELGAFGVVLLLYVVDRLVGQPRRDTAHAKVVTDIVKQFTMERKEDRDHMERITNKLAGSIDKLSAELDQIRRDRAA